MEIFVALGSSVVQARVTAKQVFRGSPGSAQAAQKPLVVTVCGEENTRGREVKLAYSLAREIQIQAEASLPSSFMTASPEAPSFETLSLTLRVLVDDGNLWQALLLGGLGALYSLLAERERVSGDVGNSGILNELDTSEPKIYFPIIMHHFGGLERDGNNG